MSVEIHVFMQDLQVPEREQWQKAIEEAGFPIVLDPALDLRKDKGFSPTTYDGFASGFELYLEPAANYLNSYPEIQENVGTRDKCVSFRWGADTVRAAAAISAAAVLTTFTEGIYFDPETGRVFTSDAVFEGIYEDLSAIANEMESV